jgi:hypothetical protein
MRSLFGTFELLDFVHRYALQKCTKVRELDLFSASSERFYRPISLLSIISKLLEKLLIKRIRSDPNTEEWLSANKDPAIATFTLQNHLNQIQEWSNIWKIKINEAKSTQVNFSLRREQCPAVFLNNVQIPASPSTKYLDIYLDNHLTWKEHIRKKRKQIDLKIKDMYWIIGRNSKLSLENKILLYKTIIKPIWTYVAEIWGCASNSNISVIQRCQSKILCMIANAPWYVPNITLHEDLNVPLVKEVIKQTSTIYQIKIGHVNRLIQPLLQPHNQRRLKRNWPADLREG